MSARSLWIAIGAISLVGISALLISRSHANSSAKDAKADLAVVTVAKVQPAEISELLTYPARVVAKINTHVFSEIDGVVSQIRKPLGEKVSRGQVLLTMSHTDPVYQYAPVQVLSPVSGVVSSVDVTEGTQVLKGAPLVSVTDPKRIRIQIEIPAADLGLLAPQLLGELQVSDGKQTASVKVRGISPFVDPTTGTATAELDLVEGASFRPVPGELGQVRFKTGVHTGFSVPDYAVVYRGSSTFLRLIEDGKLRSVAVTLGKRQNGSVEVLSGLSPGLTVVQRASRYVADGDLVTVQTNSTGQTGDAGSP